MKVINLFENTKGRPGCAAEHGLSFYIETKKHKLLMDTGVSDLLIENAECCGVDLAAVDTVVISHGHYDHADGLVSFTKMNPHAKIYIQKDANGAFYDINPDGTKGKYIGIDPVVRTLPQIEWVDGDLTIDDELFLFSGISGTKFRPSGNAELKKEVDGELMQDHFAHEQCLVVKQDGKRILFSGCAHSGILNVLDRFAEVCGSEPDVVISGFHMMKKGRYDKEELRAILKTAHELEKTKTVYYTCHCTGERAYELMRRVMGNQIRYVHCGEEIEVLPKKKRRRSYMKWHRFFAWGTVVCFVLTMVTGYQRK